MKTIFYKIKKIAHFFIDPLVNGYKAIVILIQSKSARKNYELIEYQIKEREESKIRVAAYVVFGSTFGMESVFDRMMDRKKTWDCKIVIIPDVSRGERNQEEVYYSTKQHFIKKYGQECVLDGWDIKTNKYIDHTSSFDIIYYANPYDKMVHRNHSIKHGIKMGVLPVYISYGYDVGQITTLSRLKNPELNLIWKYFVDTTYSLDDLKKHQVVKGRNAVLTGYCKMDKLSQYDYKETERKKILIAAHHTVDTDIIPLSNFLYYYKLILQLPKIYPGVDFVFRPHPLLFTTLVNKRIWTQEQVEQYINCFMNNGGTYSCEGDYLQLFVDCDAIINDCGSFTIEWLYTGKPGCFVYNSKLKEKQLTTLMKNAISCYTIARSEKEIIGFIDDIISEKKKCGEISPWIKDNIMLNYPNTASVILDELNIRGDRS